MIPAATTPSITGVFKAVRLREQKPEVADKIAKEFALSSVAARILAARGYDVDDTLRHFITPTLKEGLPDPKKLKNLSEACALIAEACAGGGALAICCDFDVDGLSGGAQLHHFLTSAGISSKVFVPDRFADGYGLNERMVREIAASKFALMICVDYGTTNAKELKLARELGLKTIVVDHHHVGSHVCGADVFVNPQQEGCGFANGVLCASGLVWYLLIGLKRALAGAAKIEIKDYLDLASLGTICDMVPLIGANRIIARRGLELMGATTRPGLIALKNVIGIRSEVSCSDISFGIGPRLNAAGRMVHGEVVIELLTTSDNSRAEKLARKLHKLNADRQEAELLVKEMAVGQIEELGTVPSGLVVWNPEFHTGVIGIVAQRLVETFYRPAAVMGADTEGVFKGSVRGIKGFSVVEALGSAQVKKHLIKFGGHEGAGGFSVEQDKVQAFADAFVAECEKRLAKLDVQPYADADTEVTIAELEKKTVDELKKFAPFGMGNPNPQVLIRNLQVCDVRCLKDAHLKTTLTDGKRYITGLMWRCKQHPRLVQGAKVNVVCRPEFSSYSGLMELQANLQAIEKA